MIAPRSTNIKTFLLVVAIVIVLGTLYYTHRIVEQLLQKERQVADLYAKSLEFVANNSSDQSDYSFIFDEMIATIDFPMVLTDSGNKPIPPNFLTTIRNVDLDTTLSLSMQEEFLNNYIHTLDQQNPPIKVKYQDTIIVTLVHYGESKNITQLRILPYIVLVVGGMFIIVGYIGFSYIKRNEQSNIWVGMAKETAHQLGTPLSSLMGWIAMLQDQTSGNSKALETTNEMTNDLKRLNKVAERFSKIGSKPNLKEENLNEVINSVIQYFKKRLPSKLAQGRHIDISIETTQSVSCKINRELFEWVIENLIKNAIDAIEDKSGSIVFNIGAKGNEVLIDVKDSGKGIDMKNKKDIFRPGYSTKQRGWGLGLSLSRRIVETYHKGKLFVKESKVGKGTTFRIKLSK